MQPAGTDGLVVVPAWLEGQSAAYVVAEVWQGVPEAWLQPWYVLFQEPPTGPPATRIQSAEPVIDVVPPSFFYSPFWQLIDVVIPPGASPDAYRDARTLVDPSLPHIESSPLLAVLPPGDAGIASPAGVAPVRPLSGDPVASPRTTVLWVRGTHQSSLNFGSGGFSWGESGRIVEVPLYRFIRFDGRTLLLPDVLGSGPEGQAAPLSFGTTGAPRAGAFTHLVLVALPTSAGVFLPPDAPLRGAAVLAGAVQMPEPAPENPRSSGCSPVLRPGRAESSLLLRRGWLPRELPLARPAERGRGRPGGPTSPGSSLHLPPGRLRRKAGAAMTRALMPCLLAALPVLAQPAAPEGEGSEPLGYTPPQATRSPFRISGYVDVGWAKATGNGSSFVPGDTRVPADYYVDPFAPAVNSRGDVASIDAGGRFVNGFLPTTVGSGGHGTFLLNVASLDLQVTPSGVPVLAFVRAQALPRWNGNGSETQFVLQQAFGRVSPFSSQELSISAGRFDSVFGIEYLENESNLRLGITPSLIARYSTGHPLGLKVFYRFQLPSIQSAILHQRRGDQSWLAGRIAPGRDPQLHRRSGRQRATRLRAVAARDGAQAGGERAVRTAERPDRSGVIQKQVGFDARVFVGPVSVWGEYVSLREDPATAPPKPTGTGIYTIASGFKVHGFYLQLAYALPVHDRVLSGASVYGRYDRRTGGFDGTPQLLTSRWTVGGRIELWSVLQLKAEVLFNRENAGAPTVDNDVFTTSAVFSF